jgi:hypothetical protein
VGTGSFEEVSLVDTHRELRGSVLMRLSGRLIEGSGSGVRATSLPCTAHDDGGWIAVNGMPRNPDNHVRQIDRRVEKCPEKHELM